MIPPIISLTEYNDFKESGSPFDCILLLLYKMIGKYNIYNLEDVSPSLVDQLQLEVAYI